MERNGEEREFIEPITTTSVILWVLQSIGSGVIGWVTWCVLNRFRKSKTDVDTNVEKEVS